MDLYQFDEDYLNRLRSADYETERHFNSYFSRMLSLKLRCKLRDAALIPDVIQETLCRVFVKIRSEDSIREPDKLGAFVHSTCTFVLYEQYRKQKGSVPLDEERHDPPDTTVDLEQQAARQQVQGMVRKALALLPLKDSRILMALFIDDVDKDEICRRFHVDRDYLRVLLYRSKKKFREVWSEKKG